LIIVEGWNAGNQFEGDIQLEVLAYEFNAYVGPTPQFSSFSSCPASNVSLSLDNASDFPSNATYSWNVGGTPYTGANPVVDLSSYNPGDVVNVTVQVTTGWPVWDPNCQPPTTLTATGTITIVASPPYNGGQISCAACANPVLIGTSFTIEADATNPPQGPSLDLIVSTDGGATWSVVVSNPTFPYTVNVPQDISEVGNRLYRVVARPAAGCPGSPDSSNAITVNITDRPGNRLANAIPISLTYNSTTQRWEATISDDVTSPGLTNEYGSGTGSSNPRGTGAREIFFLLTLPACMDSLQLSLCGGAVFDTYLSMINLSLEDTIANDDGGCGLRSAFTAIAGLGSSPITPASALLDYVRDTMRLAQGDQVVIIVEAYSANSSNQGPFTLQIQGWGGSARPAPNLGSDQTVCVSQGTLSLDATTTGATTYEWVVNGSVVSGANSATYSLPLSVGTHTVIARAIFPNPNGVACNDTTTSPPITITVDPEPNASIAVGSTTYSSGQTHNITATGSSVSEAFTASSTVSGNSYQWELYNPGNTTTNPDAIGSGGTFNHTFNASGVYTLILISTNGACGPERDTLFVNVSLTTALGVGSGSFAAFPNPSTGSFTVVAPAAGSYDLRILDVAGKLVYADRMEGERKDLRLNLPAGTYQLVLSDGGRTGTARLFVID